MKLNIPKYILPVFNIALFNPKGQIAAQQKSLIITAVLLMLIVVIPVLIMTFYISWKYRAGKKSQYTPNWDFSPKLEFIWWAFPTAIILLIATMTWKSTYALDPYKSIESDVKPITIQVVALQWKWLFIYPEQNIATINFFQFPEKTPIHFQLTADAPMNSFWIPQLGGQMYAMAGMTTQLNLIADEPGEFAGSAAEINGHGFSDMGFLAKSTSPMDFEAWVLSVRQSSLPLTIKNYEDLAKPTTNNPKTLYSTVENNLLDYVIMKYMASGPTDHRH
jgi:cytochrome o ubiquinol oxidase subunit II